MTQYLEQVNAGGQGLILDNREDDHSLLQDEIYKTVTTLHQTRDAALAAKHNFADNLYNIAHQLKTPITAISLSAQMMADNPDPAYARQIQKQVTQLTHLEEGLLLLSRIDAGTLVLEKTSSDVFTILTLAADMLKELSVHSDVTIDVPEMGEVALTVDVEWTMEAILNLMKNCMEHSPAGAAVHCSYEQNPLYVQIRIWDEGTGFEKADLPYLSGRSETSVLQQAGPDIPQKQAVELPVLAYTREVPVLREEYGTLNLYELVHFLPASLWREIKGQIGGAEPDIQIRVLAGETATLEDLNSLQTKILKTLGSDYETLIENRIQDKINNDHMIHGMMTVLGGFCVLLALIGIGNLFSNTLGFVRQRKREFARYQSIGLTPKGLKKLFCIEALVLAGRPVLITLPLTVLLMGCMLKLSYMEPMSFIREAPVLPILTFLLAIIGCVALAYYLGWRKVTSVSLTDALRDDTML